LATLTTPASFAAAPRGQRFVLMDCGAWVGLNFLSDTLDAPIANAQIGVKVGGRRPPHLPAGL
jgi:hypothetical protein